MTTLREWMRRLWGTFRKDVREREMEEELRLHLELAGEDVRRRGGAPEDAHRTARLRAGGAAQAMEAMRDQRRLPWLDDLARDVRLGLRSLRRSPAFTAIALLTLALGIGANTAIFSIVNGVVLRPLGYPQPEQLMHLTTQFPGLGFDQFWVSPPEYLEFREMSQSFSAVGAYTTGEANLTAGDRPLRVRSARVDEHLLNALGLQVAEGRLFAAGETDTSGTLPPPIAILSNELWRSALGGEPVVGRTVEVDGRPHEIIGILPSGADLMDHRAEIWLPLGLNPANRQNRGNHTLSLIGRLKDGVAAQSAQSEIDALMENWGERAGLAGDGIEGHVPTNPEHLLQMKPLQDEVVGSARRSIWVLQAAVGLVLLIACANLASLLLARAETRQHEFALRTALGAGRGRLFRQLVTEGLLLSIAGGVLGLLLARGAVEALLQTYSTSLPRTNEIAIDPLVLLFTLGVATASGLLFGLGPMMHTRVKGLVTALKEGGTKGATSAARHHVRRGLVAAEVALAVMLVIGAALLVRTVYHLTTVDAGFDRSRLMTFSMTLPLATSEPSTRAQMYQRLLDELRALPGVQGATAMTGLPPNRPVNANDTEIDNYTAPPEGPWENVDYYQIVMSDYFETMGIPIVDGRSFEPTDAASSGFVVVVNETLVNTFWPGQNPVGQRLRPCCGDGAPWFTVIGVGQDVKQGGVDQATGTEVYFFVEQTVQFMPETMNVVLRTALPLAVLSPTIQDVVREVDSSVPIVRLREMDAVFAESIQRPRLLAELVGGFAALALLLAAIGTYGVLSYMVAERRREIGIRLALGATRGSVLAGVMKQGLVLTAVGVAIGVAGALILNQLMASLLFGVAPTDAATMAAAIAAITLVAAAACWLPAWRASRLDPNVMLRDE